MIDWYARRDELESNQMFRTHCGEVVKLVERMVPGDGTRWYVATWWRGWSYQDDTIEPCDLEERLLIEPEIDV